MRRELELDRTCSSERPSEPCARRWRSLVRSWFLGGLHWAPVWAALLFLGQLVWLGFLPARADSRRLDRAEAEVRARAKDLEAERAEIECRSRMLSDEVFQERVRRSLVDPGAVPLTLDRARSKE